MKTAIITDIHSNIEALTVVLDDIDRQGYDRIICLGDVVGYGADPNACCDVIRERNILTLLGNHDAAVTGAMDESYYYQGARNAIQWTRDKLTEENYRWLYSLPYTYVEEDVGFFHSAPVMPSGFFYVVQNQEAMAHSQIVDRLKPISFIGHAHQVMVFAINAKQAVLVKHTDIKISNHTRYIANIGSVGQPRDRDPRACYAVWDHTAKKLEYIRLEYDIKSAADKIFAAGLDSKFGNRLFKGL
ncbi:MAG: metallophosphoesterase family protein [Myxococcota bacterium]|jgi:diadenosine tetraphosphatase ApaH/serine/threonine PP2A family protein phosphatase|nr:metallophosphoesterase family protein [Myxococcota bacterium]MBP8970530.1 metallophosphoesterase family protein [Myxococcota bacterium]HHW97273.1 metallophosphoesterase family protein [Oligoflexales bacterium]HQC44771.1 metallophosphoesterase family protein [Myxococcota bacterium]HQL57249.1 metallophosphoesterase family protein [Myxococcota bacterium]